MGSDIFTPLICIGNHKPLKNIEQCFVVLKQRKLGGGLKIIAAMIRNQTPYDAAVHTRNQLQHGSWVMQLQPVQIIKKDAS